MANTKKAALLIVAAALGAACLGGCRKTTYTYRCVDGFVSRSTNDATALAGCDFHGGAINKTPEISRSPYRSSSSRRYRSSSRRSRSSSRKKR